MTHGLLFTIARWLVAFLFLFSGVSKITSFAGTKAMMSQYSFPLPAIALLGAIGIEVGGGLLLAFGLLVRPVTVILGLYVIAASLMVWGSSCGTRHCA
jgi:putative oxidoreductase